MVSKTILFNVLHLETKYRISSNILISHRFSIIMEHNSAVR